MAPPANGRHERVRDGGARQQAEEHTQRDGEVVERAEARHRAGDIADAGEDVGSAEVCQSSARGGDVGAVLPPHEQVVLVGVDAAADCPRDALGRHPTALVVVGV